MLTTVLAAAVLNASGVHLEAKLPAATFSRGQKIRIEIYAVNNTAQEVVMGRSAIGNFAGYMKSEITYVGNAKVEPDHYNPNIGQIMIGSTITVAEEEFAVIPPKGKALIFFEEIKGEWKDGYTRSTAPRGIEPISIPTRAGEYKFSFTYTFNRKTENERLKNASYSAGYRLDEHVIPEFKRKVVFAGNARSRFDSALEGKWTVSGAFKVAER